MGHLHFYVRTNMNIKIKKHRERCFKRGFGLRGSSIYCLRWPLGGSRVLWLAGPILKSDQRGSNPSFPVYQRGILDRLLTALPTPQDLHHPYILVGKMLVPTSWNQWED